MQVGHRHATFQWLQRVSQRHWVPLLLGIIATIAIFGLWQQLLVQEDHHIQQLVQQEATAVELELHRELSQRIFALERMADRWRFVGGTPQAIWEADAANQAQHTYGYQAIEWVDPSFHVRWIVPRHSNQSAQNRHLGEEERQQVILRTARDLRQTLLTRRLSLPQGQDGFFACIPLFLDQNPQQPGAEQFDGFILGVFQFKTLFDSILQDSPRYKVQIFDENGLIYSQPGATPSRFTQRVVVQAYSADWQVQVTPTMALIAQGRSPFPTVVLWGGLVGAWLTALLVYLGQRAACQAHKAHQVNQQLQHEIVQRQQAEASLRASEERWQLALHGNNDGIWDWNVQTNEVFFSSRWKEMLGFADHEIQNHLDEWSKRIHPDDIASVTQTILEHFAQKTPFYISEHRLQCKDGSYKWILDRGQALWDETGTVMRMAGSHTDITNRKQAELALQESETRYRQLVDHINVGFVVHAPNTRILQCNATACKLLGLSMEQMMGKAAIDSTWKFLREDGTVMPPAEFPVNRVRSTLQPLENYIVGIVRGTQSQLWVLVTAFPEFDAAQQLKQVVVTFIDISELKQAETTLREMSEVMQNAVSGIAQLDLEGRYQYVNKAYAEMAGYHPEDMIGMSWEMTIQPCQLAQVHQAYQAMRHTGKVELEVKGRRQDGSSFYKQIMMIASYTKQQEFNGHYCFVKDISDRKRAEDNLRQSEEKFRTAIDFTYNWEYWQAPDASFVYVSPSCERITGYPPTDFIQDPHLLHTIIHPNDRPLFEQHACRICREIAETGVIEFRIITRNGETRWIAHICQPVFSQTGDYLGQRASNRDVSERVRLETARQQAEDALRQSEATKQAIIQAIPDLLIRMHCDGSYVDFISNSKFNLVNPSHTRQNINVYDILPPHLAELRMHYSQQALATGQTQIYEHEIIIEGNQYYEEVRIVPLLQSEILIMVRDITDRKQAEVDLLHQKEMFQAIVNHIPVMIALFDQNGHIELVNPELEKILGWSLTEWQQDNVFAQCYPRMIDQQIVLEHMLAASGRWKDMVTITASGQSLATSWAHVKLSNGHCLGIGQDISDRKQKEVALRQAMEAAETANLAKSMFLANMSHELRTPLNVILGFAQVMAHDPSLSPVQQADLQTIRRSGDHLLSLINDILDLSKIEAGHCTLDETGFDLISLLHSLRTMMLERAQAKQLHLTFEIASEVPQFVIADEQKLRQILLNLLSNAIKFTHEGQVKLSVSVKPNPLPWGNHPTPSDDSANLMPAVPGSPLHHKHQVLLCFEVSDTGVGIAAAELESIFDAFVQAEAGRKSVSGTGLGLTISRKLLELMAGKIAVHSTPNVGSTFTLTVPVCPTGGVDIQSDQLNRMVIGLAPGQPQHRVLVVDDQHENRLLMVRLLTQLGLEVREAANGQEAIRIWEEWQPELTWMDIRMPVLDGYEATRQIRAMEAAHSTIIIALTAQASQSDRSLALAAGCNDYISKPFREETVFLKMAEYLGFEYLYADTTIANDATLATAGLSSEQLAQLFAATPELRSPPLPNLSALSPEWLQQLEEAAMCGNDRAILRLTEQLAPEFSAFKERLTALVQQFEFEQILNLLNRPTPS